MKYQKKTTKVNIEFAKSDGVVQTLEGPVSYLAGDALASGALDERWPISRKQFEISYEPVFPTHMGRDGQYIKKPLTVDAHQCHSEQHVTINNQNNSLRANIGDWIVSDQNGGRWIVNDEIFQLTYERIV